MKLALGCNWRLHKHCARSWAQNGISWNSNWDGRFAERFYFGRWTRQKSNLCTQVWRNCCKYRGERKGFYLHCKNIFKYSVSIDGLFIPFQRVTFRDIFGHLDGSTSGYNSYSGFVGKLLENIVERSGYLFPVLKFWSLTSLKWMLNWSWA